MSAIRRLVQGAAVAGAVTATALGAAPATAQVSSSSAAVGDIVALIPYVAPKVDVAQGIGFPAIARDSSGISYAESYVVDAGSNGHVILRNRHWKDGLHPVCLDIQDTAAQGPSNPGHGSAVGLSACDGSSTQQWKIADNTFGGAYYNSTLTNKHSGLQLTFAGSGANPAYTQTSTTSLGDRRFVVTYLGTL